MSEEESIEQIENTINNREPVKEAITEEVKKKLKLLKKKNQNLNLNKLKPNLKLK